MRRAMIRPPRAPVGLYKPHSLDQLEKQSKQTEENQQQEIEEKGSQTKT
jgi:hypothetical protein